MVGAVIFGLSSSRKWEKCGNKDTRNLDGREYTAINDLENRHLQRLKVVKNPEPRKCNYQAIMGETSIRQSAVPRDEHSLTQFWGKSKTILRHPRTGSVLVESSTANGQGASIWLLAWSFRYLCCASDRLAFSKAG